MTDLVCGSCMCWEDKSWKMPSFVTSCSLSVFICGWFASASPPPLLKCFRVSEEGFGNSALPCPDWMHCLHFSPRPPVRPVLAHGATVLHCSLPWKLRLRFNSSLCVCTLSQAKPVFKWFPSSCCHISLQDPCIGLFPGLLASYSSCLCHPPHSFQKTSQFIPLSSSEIINGSPLLTSRNISQSLFCGTPNTVPLVTLKRNFGKCFKLYPSWGFGMPITMVNTLRGSKISQMLWLWQFFFFFLAWFSYLMKRKPGP